MSFARVRGSMSRETLTAAGKHLMKYEIVIDHSETGSQCSIQPLRGRPDFKFFGVSGEGPLGPLSAPILLHPDGKCLTEMDLPPTVSALASVDCVWIRLPKIIRRLSWTDTPAVLAKIPDGFVTAYPRVSKLTSDPKGGLATVEALFAAAALLGNWDVSLLSRYYFGRLFVERNAKLFVELGVAHPANDAEWPPRVVPQRTALARRINRGRMPKGMSPPSHFS